MLQQNRPENYAVTIQAPGELRCFYIDTKEEFEEFVRELLIEDDDERSFFADFKIYSKLGGEWIEQDFDPYDFFTDVDDTPYPIAHGQLLARFGEDIDHKVLWDIGQGRKKLIHEASDNKSTQYLLEEARQNFDDLGVWDDPFFEEEEDELEDVFGTFWAKEDILTVNSDGQTTFFIPNGSTVEVDEVVDGLFEVKSSCSWKKDFSDDDSIFLNLDDLESLIGDD